jgi:hypothetical protein
VLILIGPAFEGGEASFSLLAQLTGLVAYDLKSKLRPGAWGVLRVLGDVEQARSLTQQLRAGGFPAVLVDAGLLHDPKRRIVAVESLALHPEQLMLSIQGQLMPVPLKGILTIVRGETHVRSVRQSSSPSSGSSYRSIVPTAEDIQAFRESHTTVSYESYQLADIHFATVTWVARLDARKTDVSQLGQFEGSPSQRLDQVVERLANLTGVRVDRSVRTSSLAGFAAQPASMRRSTPAPNGAAASREAKPAASDPRFDAYSRLVAQAERALQGFD